MKPFKQYNKIDSNKPNKKNPKLHRSKSEIDEGRNYQS